jgi:hypothetical protein
LGTPVYIFGRSVIAKGDTLAEAVAAFREGIRASRGAK